jgi:hypothetical protein
MSHLNFWSARTEWWRCSLLFNRWRFCILKVPISVSKASPRRAPHHTLPPKGGRSDNNPKPSRSVFFVLVHKTLRCNAARKWRGISVPMTRVARGQVVQRDKISITRRSDRTIRIVERPKRSALGKRRRKCRPFGTMGKAICVRGTTRPRDFWD